MPQYIEFNGETIEFPDNMSDAQIAAALKGQSTPTPTAGIPGQTAKAPPAQQEAPSTMEQMFGAGSPIARTLKGAIVDPALAVNQMLANTGLFAQMITPEIDSSRIVVFHGIPDYIKIVATEVDDGATVTCKVQPFNA